MKNRAKASILAGMFAFSIFLSGCNATHDVKVATVDGTPITKSEYDKTYGDFEKAFRMENVPEAQKGMLADTLKRMTLNKLIFQTLMYNEAAKAGIKVTEDDVKAYKKTKIMNDPVLAKQFKAFLDQNKMTEADFDNMLKDNLLVNKLMEQKGGAEVQVSDAEVQAFYTKNKDQFKMPERIHSSHILVKAIVPQMKQELRAKDPKISDADLDKAIAEKRNVLKAKADKLFNEVKAAPTKFPELAKTNSDDPISAKEGGDLGFMAEGGTDPAFWAAIEKTPKGQLYPGVVASQFGYHIVKVEEREAPHMQSFDEAKNMIKEHMAQTKKQIFMQKWAEQQKAVAKINIEPQFQPKEAELTPGGGPLPAAATPNQQAVGHAPAAATPQAVAPSKAAH